MNYYFPDFWYTLATTPTNNAMVTEFNDEDVPYQFTAPDDTVYYSQSSHSFSELFYLSNA